MHRTDYSSNNFASVNSCTQNSYWHKAEIIPHVTPAFLLPTSDNSSITTTLDTYQCNCFETIHLGYSWRQRLPINWSLASLATCHMWLQDTSTSTLLHKFPWWMEVREVSSHVHPPRSTREHLFLPLQWQDMSNSTLLLDYKVLNQQIR